ncbi:MAG: hypothetical protein U5N56_08780 [Candidatus Marinimicrobia bacterium]|nr:hypothetical protein [Candidatus Neomarinimicrobiota bacterium]
MGYYHCRRGPAGIFAALKAAEEGRSVLLLERKREMGVPVRCGKRSE